MEKYTVLKSLEDSNDLLQRVITNKFLKKEFREEAEKQHCWNCITISNIKIDNHTLK